MGHLCSTVHIGTYHNHLHFFSTSHHHDFTLWAAKYSVLILHRTGESEHLHLHIFTVYLLELAKKEMNFMYEVCQFN